MDKLQAMQLFARVVDSGSFTAAAEQMDISRALASKLIQGLEDELGVRLLNRTTRTLSLTDPGQNYYQRVVDILGQVAEAEAEAAELQIEPRGKLRVSAPMSFANGHLAPAIAEFRRLHPRVELDLVLSDRLVDLVDEGFDLAVRISRLADSTLVARRIVPCSVLAVAAPDYVAKRGMPDHPDQLIDHDCLHYTLATRGDEWAFVRDEEHVSVRIQSRTLSANSGDFLAEAAMAGAGITLLPSFIIADALRSGRLVRVLREWSLPQLGIYAVYPQTRALPAKTRLLIDFLVERFGPEPYWERDLP